MYNFERKVISEPEDIQVEFFDVEKALAHKVDILVAKINGVYPDGSMGNEHATYIKSQVIAALSYFDPVALILDFRELEYNWGNSISGIFEDITRYMDFDREEDEPFFPYSIVVSEKSQGLLSLSSSNGKLPENMFQNLNEAINYTSKKGKEWLDY